MTLEIRPTRHFVGRNPTVLKVAPAKATTGAMDLATGGQAGLSYDAWLGRRGYARKQGLDGRRRIDRLELKIEVGRAFARLENGCGR